MTLWEHFKTALESIWSTKLRTALTVMAVTIGVAAVVFLVAMGEGQRNQMTKMFEDMGANAIYVTSTSREVTGTRGKLTMRDVEALIDSKKAPSVGIVAPLYTKGLPVTYGNKKINSSCIGATEEIGMIQNYPVAQGKFISRMDVDRRTSVAVLGHQAAIDLFNVENPIGKSIRVGGFQFQVIGVVEELGGRSGDSFVLIPLTTMQTRIGTERTTSGHAVQTIAVQAVSTDKVSDAVAEVTSILRQRHRLREGEDSDFNVINMTEILARMQQTMAAFAMFLTFVGAIALTVGGIGIMNIMLVSVTERTREIGIRKAVGANRRDIINQFLIEAALLSFFGGIVGLLMALGVIQLMGTLRLGSYAIVPQASPEIMIIALSVSVAVGLVSGTYPAVLAANLDPIECLRHE